MNDTPGQDDRGRDDRAKGRGPLAVSGAGLTRVAGVVWIAVGTMLAVRGALMLWRAHQEPESAGWLAIAISALVWVWIGQMKGRYVLIRSARKNRARLVELDGAPPWAIFPPTLWLLVIGMIGLGIGLRALAAKGWLGGFTMIGGLYVGIGAALIASARGYFQAPPPPVPTRIDGPPRGARGASGGEGQERARAASPSDSESGSNASPPATSSPNATILSATRSNGAAPIGVLLVNLGTPDAPTPDAVRRYLREFLSDPLVVEAPRALWWFVLNVIILPRRGGVAAEAYQTIWTEEGSPLLVQSRRAADALARELGDDYRVALGMRYGNPSIASTLDELVAAGCETIRVLPLFPQYSAATIGSAYLEVTRRAGERRHQPCLQFLPPFPDEPGTIDAFAERVEEARAGREVDLVVISFHGLPEAQVRAGDPYLEHCQRTAWALAERLGLERDEWEMVFQSRFGADPWLQPYLDEFVLARAKSHPRILVALPAFTADCLETLEEVGVRLREDFEAAGGELLLVTESLNDSPTWIAAMAGMVRGNSALD